MPLFGEKFYCSKCSKDETLMWHKTPKGIQCNDCHEIENSAKVVEEDEQNPTAPAEKPKTMTTKKGNKTARSYKTRQNPNALPKQFSTKGKGRRSIFKKKEPVKLAAVPATYTTSTTVFYKGTQWRSGDIVSVRDMDGDIYYAQLKYFLTDMYCEKSASFTWLIPTRDDSPFRKQGFDPMRFVIGPEEDAPHKLDYMEFVMHCPSNYFRENIPYPSGLPDPKYAGYIWGRLSPEDKLAKE